MLGEGVQIADFEGEVGEVGADDDRAGGVVFAELDEFLALGCFQEDELGTAGGGVAGDLLESEDLGVEVNGSFEVLDAVAGVKELGDHEAGFSGFRFPEAGLCVRLAGVWGKTRSEREWRLAGSQERARAEPIGLKPG